MHDLTPFLDPLASYAHPEGGWGYAPGQPAHLEPTCLALLALSPERDRFAPAIKQGKLALQKCAAGDGMYRLARGRDEAAWPTALVLFVQAALGEPAATVGRTASSLLALRGRTPEKGQAVEESDIDAQIVGWPWAAGNFSWAEPTA